MQDWPTTVWLFSLILGLWSLWRAIRGQGVNGNFLGALAIAEILISSPGGSGRYAVPHRPRGQYCPTRPYTSYTARFPLVFLPFVFLYWLRGDDSNRAQWVLTFAVLFQFGTIFYRFGPYALT